MTRKRKWLLAGGCSLLIALAYSLLVDTTIRCRPPELTRTQVMHIAYAIEQYRSDTGHYPVTLAVLFDPGPPGYGPYLSDRSLRDPWGRQLYYRVERDGASFVLFSLGKDGRIAGDGPDKDVGTFGCPGCDE